MILTRDFLFLFFILMDKKYLTYDDFVEQIKIFFMLDSSFGEDSSILFTPDKIIISNKKYTVAHNIIDMTPIDRDGDETFCLRIKIWDQLYQGGWRWTDNYCHWRVWDQYKYYDIIDFWIYRELIKHPEIIKRILASRIRFQGIPCETDKFQGFWLGDVNFRYL